jgi:tetratricopeptide (TPR) repeat protein
LAHVITARMARIWSAQIAIAVGDRTACEDLYASFDPADDSTACWGPFALTCWPAIAHYLGELALALGRPEAARAHAELALRVCDRMNARGHRAWVKLGLGRALGSHASARSHLEEALELACELDMPELRAQAERSLQDRPAARSSKSSRAPAQVQAPEFRIVESGDVFAIEHAGQTFRLKPMRGLKMLARLCERPGQEIHALDLVAEDGGASGAADHGDAGDVIDLRARDAYKARIAALREEIDDPETQPDPGRAQRAREELEALTQQLAAAFGLGGRPRRSSSAAERARISAQRRLREAIRKIAEQDPALGRHLDWTIRTGLFCAYEPSGRVG